MSHVINEGSFGCLHNGSAIMQTQMSEAFSISAHIKLYFLSEEAYLKNGTIEAFI